MRCDQCIHWRPSDDPDDLGFGLCSSGVRQIWEIQNEAASPGILPTDKAGREEWQRKRSSALRAVRAYVGDSEEYSGPLWTAPDFYCAAFERKS